MNSFSNSSGNSSNNQTAINVNQQHLYNQENAAIDASLAYETRTVVETIRLYRHYPDDIVTEMKIVRYVKELFDRGIESTTRNVDGTATTIRISYSHETLKMHIKALVGLYAKQKADYKDTMTLEHPRGDTLKSFESSLKRLCSAARQSESFIDPGIGSIQDRYNAEQLVKIANYYLEREKKPGDALRDRMMFPLNHMMMSRDEGATRCPVFVMMITGGKTNQEHHKLYSGVIRHKNVHICAFGAVGFYLFHRFHVKGEAFPDFASNANWFNVKLARGSRSSEKSVTYNTQLTSVNNAFAAVGINSVKKTHSGRQAGAREAEMAGLSHDHIRRVGRWNSESMENNYLTCLPRTAIRVIGGFPEEKGCFWLPRSLLSPPLTLQRKIFPMVEEWQADPSCQTICGEDAVFLKQQAEEHEMFQQEIFQSEEFNSFAENLNRCINSTTPPSEIEIQRIVPEINSRISDLALQIQSVHNTTANNSSISAELIEAISSNVVKKIEERFGSVLANAQQSEAAIASLTPATNVSSGAQRREREDECDGNDRRKHYKLSRNLSNVTSLWREWSVGLGDGNPSVATLNEEYGSKWRQEAKERKYYSKRLVIINEIQKVANNNGLSLEDAAQSVENERIASISAELIEAISSNVVKKIEERFGSVLANAQPMQTQSETAIASFTTATNISSGTQRREREDECDGNNRRKYCKLSRNLANVTSLWREWNVGLGDGNPSVACLNEEYVSLYTFLLKLERKYYKSLVIINEIQKVANNNGLSLEDAAQSVENERIAFDGCSLDKLSKIISKDLESDSSEEEWVMSNVHESKQQLKQNHHHQLRQTAVATNNYSRSRPTLSAASFRMAKAYLPSPSSIAPFKPPAATADYTAINKSKSTPVAKLAVQSETDDTSPDETEVVATATAAAPSSTHISNEELVEICTNMNASLLITRLVNVYKSVEIYIRIREIETGSVIESRLKDCLHYCDNPCDFILNTLIALSNYFSDNSKNKDLTSKFRRLLASNLCSALAKFLETPLDKQIEQSKLKTRQQEQQHKINESAPEVDLITFDDESDGKQNDDVDLISFDDIDQSNTCGKQHTDTIVDDSEQDDDYADYEEDDDEDDDDEEQIITLAELLGVPASVLDQYTLTREHQLKLVQIIDTIPSPVIVYYAMDVFKLFQLIGFGCELENDGIKLCRALMKHGYYDEAVASIRKLELLPRFPPDSIADHFFTAGHGMYLPTLYSGYPDFQKQLLSFIDKQLRFNYAGNLGVVPEQYLTDLFDGTDKTRQLSRLKERKFQKDLVNCGAKIMKELNIASGDDYYFISLSQRYACLRYILAQRAIQQLEDNDTSIDASSNFNGLIDLVCEDDPVLARLAIKELIDTGDVVAPPYFASLYKQQEFYCRYNALPLNQRLLGVVKGEQLSRHRTTFSRKKPVKTQPENFYKLSSYVKCILVDSEATLMQMKAILSSSTICGLDTEWVPTFAKTAFVQTALMQIASDIDGYVFLLDLKTIFEPRNAHLYQLTQNILEKLFENENIVKLAFDFSGDLDLLHISMPSSKDWEINNLVDMKNITSPDGKAIIGGLAGVVSTFLNVALNKRQQLSNWEKRPLTAEQAAYGASDACCLLDVYYVLCQRNHPFVKGLPRSSYLNNTQENLSPSSLTINSNSNSSFYQTPQSPPPLSSFSPSPSLLSSSPQKQYCHTSPF
ncbi:hypothetical protein [Parasitella parasitica]|uniref:3'-5' exonuclease domain-containing protein n=1 Tax=Parasitella parasitica TaxID=35722 RepID=A0A0B7NY16_9FUNG|nr:hypothetical protein [Parasitella parasitica]